VIGFPGVGKALERGDEDVLGDILGRLCVADDAEGDAHDGGVLLTEEPLEGGQRGLRRR
jgi:hypothetical protein